ncbi:MAG: hypothetical protein DRJ47_11390 [Thermoprotei archaeon]|nr:MAG: hypothetical protein DRJ47_11390 [Thermoprotei archaeon]
MKICLISNYSPPLDEGMKNVAYYLGVELKKRCEVLNLSLNGLFSKVFWQQVRDFQPQIIHYIPGPSILSLIIAKFLKLQCSGAKVLMSATQPRIPRFLKIILPLLKPDLVLTQSDETENMLAGAVYKTTFLPNGVDIERFIPVSVDTKKKLREKYGLSKGKFIILHIGSIRRRRNLRLLTELQQKNRDSQVIVVGSTSTPLEQDIYKGLVENGCIVWRRYFKNIEESYALSDCYIFPAFTKLSSIDLPLSVMEAMSCNLPVISTRFGALTRIFQEGNGLYFAETKEEFLQIIDTIKNGVEIKTREKVLPYSWIKVASRLEEIYHQAMF